MNSLSSSSIFCFISFVFRPRGERTIPLSIPLRTDTHTAITVHHSKPFKTQQRGRERRDDFDCKAFCFLFDLNVIFAAVIQIHFHRSKKTFLHEKALFPRLPAAISTSITFACQSCVGKIQSHVD